MTKPDGALSVILVAIDHITAPNPRVRSTVSFDQLVDSISKVGLKKPITLTRESKGQGRGAGRQDRQGTRYRCGFDTSQTPLA